MAFGVTIPTYGTIKSKPKVTSPYVTPGNQAPARPATATNLYNPVANQNKPGTNPRVDYLDQTMPEWRNAPGYLQGRMADALWGPDAGGYPQLPSMTPMGPGGSSGGGGGGGGAAGLDQATLDWLLGQIGQGRPQDLTQNMLDLPDPAQYFGNYDTSQFDTARQGITSGLAGVQGRANTAYDNAQAQLNQYQNPYSSAAWATNPAMSDRMQQMMNANGVPTSINADTQDQGVQADRAFGNVMALMSGNDQARQAANNRALAGDRQTTEQNLGIEGNQLNLGVNMAQARGQSAWDQMVKQAQYDAANTEASQNWQRGNTVGDTNVTNRNQWNQGVLQQLLSIIGSRAPGTTLPTDTGGWYATA